MLKQLSAGEYFGELSLFDDKPRSATVDVLMDTRLLELTRDDFADHLSRSKTAAMTVLAEMADRLRETNALLSQRAAKDALKEVEENLTWPQKVAEKVAELNGSWAFILGLAGLTAVWALGNRMLASAAFDPYPFTFYNLLLGILTALQGPLIVMTQNRQGSSVKDRGAGGDRLPREPEERGRHRAPGRGRWPRTGRLSGSGWRRSSAGGGAAGGAGEGAPGRAQQGAVGSQLIRKFTYAAAMSVRPFCTIVFREAPLGCVNSLLTGTAYFQSNALYMPSE